MNIPNIVIFSKSVGFRETPANFREVLTENDLGPNESASGPFIGPETEIRVENAWAVTSPEEILCWESIGSPLTQTSRFTEW
jgi:hypothetical protein